MTTANKITILRILLVPFFVVEVLYYVKDGHELHRLLAIISFGVAAICDGVDGYIARRYDQRYRPRLRGAAWSGSDSDDGRKSRCPATNVWQSRDSLANGHRALDIA